MKFNTLLSDFRQIKQQPNYTNTITGINFLMGLLIAFWLPLNKVIMPYLVGIWVLTWLLEGNFVKKAKNNFIDKKTILLLLLPITLYLISAIGYFYSKNKASSLFDLEVKLSLLIMPLLFLSINQLYKKHGKAILIAFLVGSILASLLCLGSAFLNSTEITNGKIIFETAIFHQFNDKTWWWLIGNRLSHFSYIYLSIFHHPSYFSMYLVFGIVIAYYFFRTTLTIRYKTISVLIILAFSIMVYLLSTRSGLIGLTATLISLTVIEFTKSRYFALIFFAAFIIVLLKALPASKLHDSFIGLKFQINGIKESKTLQNDARIKIWNNALMVIKENIFIGTGNGDVNDALMEKYQENNYTQAKEKHLNAHNQYLQSAISGGIFAAGTLLIMLIFAFIYSLSNKRIILGYLITLASFNFLFESMLDTIGGIIFFTFFYCFLIIYAPPRIKVAEKNCKFFGINHTRK